MPYEDQVYGCPADVGLQMISGKWKPRILYELFQGTRRFGELQRAISDVSRHVLTVHLRELEHAGIVRRTVYAEVPPKVEYTITDYGRSFEPILEALVHLGEEYIASHKDERDS
ncbi:hypothetical protein BBD41_15240 [Paenibacillus ihbetae]|uniref:HTH hxlR-type domain-containing protein n=1 Tax=Paenibacillus ihbetae TaxID=1870820 RepID=A0A1B2E1E2_9BACL|nr:helix-turn-helix domain-containing protein [Paenibacillus ihbetae]ANY73824.1 hypothetical protein BBD41_15240 [Paenibacillus ihbetae]